MNNSNHVLISNGDQKLQRELKKLLGSQLDVNSFDVDVCTPFYNATRPIVSQFDWYRLLSGIMDEQFEYRHTYLFVIGDTLPATMKAVYELLFHDVNKKTQRRFKPNIDVFWLPDNLIVPKMCNKITDTVVVGANGLYVLELAENPDFIKCGEILKKNDSFTRFERL